MTVDFHFETGAKVFVNGDIPGVVDRCIMSRGGTEVYRVEWWHEGSVRSAEFYPDDLKPDTTE